MSLLLPLILIVVSLIVMGVVISRKYTQLTLLDVDNLPEVKEERMKTDLWRKRAIERATSMTVEASGKSFSWFAAWSKKMKQWLIQYINTLEQKVQEQTQKVYLKKNAIVSEEDQVSEAKRLVQEAAQSYEHEEYEKAEEKYIAAIRLDQKNIDAYRGLGDVYYALNQQKEAEETYKFLLQLDPTNDKTMLKLAELAEERDDLKSAIYYYEQAILINDNISIRFFKLGELLEEVEQHETSLEAFRQAAELEPQNPKYLDKLLETSIMVGRKDLAEEVYQQLRMVNPENQKLEIFKDKIEKMVVGEISK